MQNLVQITDGKATTASLKVAEVFEKQHKHVLDAIRNLDIPEEFARPNFRPGTYLDANQQERPMCQITRDGFFFILPMDEARYLPCPLPDTKPLE